MSDSRHGRPKSRLAQRLLACGYQAIVVTLAAALLYLSGCASPGGWFSRFSRKPEVPDTSKTDATAAANATAPNGVQPAQYTSPAAGMSTAPAGANPTQTAADTRNAGAGTSDSVPQVQPSVAPPPPLPIPPSRSSRRREDPPSTTLLPSEKEIKQKWKGMTGREPDEDYAYKCYDEAEKLFQQKKYKDASKKYAEAADRWPDTLLEEDALFMQAESEFFDDNYTSANQTYDKLLENYKNSRHMDKTLSRQFAIANYWLQIHRANPSANMRPQVNDKKEPWIDTVGRAIKVFNNIHLKDPTGPLADDSLMAIAGAHFADGRWDDADEYYNMLLTQHPDSKYVPKAQMLSVRAKLRRYQGPFYDGKPIDEADDRIGQMLMEYPGEVPGHPGEREKLLQARAAVRLQMAEREFEMGEYYLRRHQYSAARYYYQQVRGEFGDTPFGKLALERMESFKDKQDPPDRFAWLDYIFPRSTKAMPIPRNLPNGNPTK